MRNRLNDSPDILQSIQPPLCPCRHRLSGRTLIPKLCLYNYECEKCAFEQWLDEFDSWREESAAVVYEQ